MTHDHVIPRLPDVPAPVFQGGVVLAVSVVCVLARPDAVGMRVALGLDAALVLVVCAAVLYHARLVVPEGARPGLEVCALPAAALVALAVAVAGTRSVALGAAAVVVAGTVGGATAHLDALRLAGRDTSLVRACLDVAGIAVMVPLGLAGATVALPAPARALLVGAGGAAVCYDALRVPRPAAATALVGTVVTGLALAAAALLAPHDDAAPGAAALILLWYGLRGVGAAVGRPHVSRSAVVEYLAFVAVAAVLLAGEGRL